ncbi:GTPase HflX [Clostridium thermarum]|uniref:GTPase HflX n=1 Tax=Clostridium thermarum TaxID=1716543 RepID=UPI0013CFD26B|nr:GTPase HflX [Clostridium thermarum]
MIYGNIDGVKKFILDQLEEIYSIKVPREEVVTEEIVKTMHSVTLVLDREISVAIDRKGHVKYVCIGDSSSVDIPIIDIREKRLSGVRIIHTHPNGISRLSALDTSALLRMKLDCIAAISVDTGKEPRITLGFCNVADGELTYETIEEISLVEAINFNFLDKVNLVERFIHDSDIKEDNEEKAIIIGSDTEESLEELRELAYACEVAVVHEVFQKKSKIDPVYYIGSGKVKEIAMLIQAVRVNVAIFDDELSGSQVRNLEESLGVKVIDRTTLILDIFARRAKSKEAKIQVELAQLKYRLPRLTGLGTVLSRTGGGIGTRGPGEKKLETDRRHIKEQIYDLKNELEKIQKVREVQREKRNKENVPRVSLVGYTNVGKSTLRNKLCDIALPKDAAAKDKVFEANMLFATLDTTTRALNLRDNRMITLTDTVGFVRKLPHDLVEAFKSTLEEVIYSDLLIHVVDCSSSEVKNQIEAVEAVLTELGAINIPKIMALNKMDKVEPEYLQRLKEDYLDKENYLDIVEISAVNGTNLELLLTAIAKNLPEKLKKAEFLIPYSDSHAAAFLHRNANILKEEYRDNGVYIEAMADQEVLNKSSNYRI